MSHPDPILQFFSYTHLQPYMRDVSRPFSLVAHDIHTNVEDSPEREVALRKLLEAKDAAVRARMIMEKK